MNPSLYSPVRPPERSAVQSPTPYSDRDFGTVSPRRYRCPTSNFGSAFSAVHISESVCDQPSRAPQRRQERSYRACPSLDIPSPVRSGPGSRDQLRSRPRQRDEVHRVGEVRSGPTRDDLPRRWRPRSHRATVGRGRLLRCPFAQRSNLAAHAVQGDRREVTRVDRSFNGLGGQAAGPADARQRIARLRPVLDRRARNRARQEPGDGSRSAEGNRRRAEGGPRSLCRGHVGAVFAARR